MADFTVRIPRVSVAIAEATLVEFVVEDGGYAQEGDPLFVIETEKVDSEIVAGASGTVHWTGDPGSVYPIGAEIGIIQAAG
jgi:pyruvate/2-oxoglutarate dehydrogenase complex dihydrolipoamide acyltransferase (E2) component